MVTVSVTPLAIGDSYQGGKVAYILQSGDPGYVAGQTRGLIAAPADQTTAMRWDNGALIATGATATALGTGSANTNAIIAAQGVTATDYAAGLARAYAGGGYHDWYLPSKDELGKLYAEPGGDRRLRPDSRRRCAVWDRPLLELHRGRCQLRLVSVLLHRHAASRLEVRPGLPGARRAGLPGRSRQQGDHRLRLRLPGGDRRRQRDAAHRVRDRALWHGRRRSGRFLHDDRRIGGRGRDASGQRGDAQRLLEPRHVHGDRRRRLYPDLRQSR